MKLELWALLYVVVGAVLSVTLARRGVITAPLDRALVAVAWPLYAPSLVGGRDELAQPDVARLARAIDAVSDATWRPLLPSSVELAALAARIAELDRRAREIEGEIAKDPANGARLSEMAEGARREQRDLVDAVARLRVEVTALRFSEGEPDDARMRVEELLVRVREARGWAGGQRA